ncbi:predicted transcriptional regulators (plasmid) [Gluconobacter frateurii NBRC 103465]|nr:predicted transcriptional regulators [Gluconobacter frateurii NBRC 103465]
MTLPKFPHNRSGALIDNQAASILRVLGHSHRLKILCALMNAPCTVRELGNLTGIKQPTLSQQLRILRDQHIVESYRIARNVSYKFRKNSYCNKIIDIIDIIRN